MALNNRRQPTHQPRPKEPKARGRPPAQLAEQQRQLFISTLEAGSTLKDACETIQASEAVVRRICREDKEFEAKFAAAKATGKTRLIRRIYAAAADDWRAATWLLERQYWQEFAWRRPDCYTVEDVINLAVRVADVARAFIPPDRHAEFLDLLQSVLGATKIGRHKGGKTNKQAMKDTAVGVTLAAIESPAEGAPAECREGGDGDEGDEMEDVVIVEAEAEVQPTSAPAPEASTDAENPA